MGNSTLLQKKAAVHRNKGTGINYCIVNATYINEYVLEITFANGHIVKTDFADALKKYAKGYYEKYLKKNNFIRFKIENGNIVWGKDWDLIFDPEKIYHNKL